MKKIIAVGVVVVLIIAGIIIYDREFREKDEVVEEEIVYPEGAEFITEEYAFSDPTFGEYGELTTVYVEEADFNDVHDGWPALPVKTTTYELPFGTKILDFVYEIPEPQTITLDKKISYGTLWSGDLTYEDPTVYETNDRYPSSFVAYQTGGGISGGELKTFLTIRNKISMT